MRVMSAELSDKNFGIIIAYLLPGFVVVNGISAASPTVAQWLAAPPHIPSVSGFLYVGLGSLGAGLTISAVRWMLLDSIHAWTGIAGPDFDFSKLHKKLDAFDAIVVSHYRYYQFYGNMFVAVPLWLGCRISAGSSLMSPVAVLSCMLLELIFFVASRDSLHKYHHRAHQLLTEQTNRIIMGS